MRKGILSEVKTRCAQKAKTLIAGVAIASMAVSCVESDIFFGNDIIPPSQDMSTRIDSTMTLKSSIMKVDSVVTSGNNYIAIGQYLDPVYGLTTTEGMTTFFHNGWDAETTEDRFGNSPTLDSMFAQFYFHVPIGDSTDKLQVRVYSVKDTLLSYFSKYYSSLDISKFKSDELICDFEVTGTDTTVTVELPESYYSQFYSKGCDDNDGFYLNDSMFMNKFKGLYFEAVNKQPTIGKEGLMYWLNFESSQIRLFYHNKNEEPDTTYTSFSFYNSYVPLGNRVYSIKQDYTYADPQQGGVDYTQIGDTTLNVDKIYMQGFSGLGARIEIDTTAIEDLKAKVKAEGFSSIALQKATIKWKVLNKGYETYSNLATRLGLYYNVYDSSFVKDYSPIDEMNSNNSYVSDLGGYLNRSQGVYEQVITSTLQKLFSKPDDEPYTTNGEYQYVVQLLPSFYELPLFNQGTIGGGASLDNAPEMVLVYTMVK